MRRIYFKIIFAGVMLSVVYADLCYTPNNAIGECIPLRLCTQLYLLLEFQPLKGNSFVRSFFCEGSNQTSIMVCCSVVQEKFAYVFDEIGIQQQENVFALTSLKNPEDCGIQSIQGSNSTGGPALLDEFPWLVYVLTVKEAESNSSRYSIACAGTLMNSRYVLTNAQCLVKAGGASTKFLVGIEEPLNKNITDDVELESESNGRRTVIHYYDLEKVLIHPSFNELYILDDIALLKLNTSISFTDNIQAVCLPLSEYKTAKPGSILSTAGYATWSSKVKVSSIIISNVGCKVIHKRRNITKFITGHEMCGIKFKDGGCHDEGLGNPVLFSDKERWYINGISSWSANCSNKVPKVYTRVSPYLKWIEANTRDAYQGDKSSDREEVDSPATLQNSKGCGRQSPKKYNPKGGPITPDEFPWMVYIAARTAVEEMLGCTGSLITSRYVLSSARCFPHSVHPSTEFVVIVEEYHLQNTTNCTKFTPFYNRNCSTWNYYELNDIMIHPSYNRWTYENDIALLRLNKVVPFANYIRPLCLPLPGLTTAQAGDTLQAATYMKWGVKGKASVRLITDKECKLRLKEMNDTRIVHKHEVCAVQFKNDGEISCHHYEGGPIMYYNNDTWYLEAIHSGNCSDVPTIYTRVADYIPWIQASVKDDRCTTPNGNMGECIPLDSCPELLRPFANPKKEEQPYLRKFICENGKRSDIMVCCPRINDILTVDDDEIKAQQLSTMAELTNLENCGLQQQSKYNPQDGFIPADEFPWLANVISHESSIDPNKKHGFIIKCTGAVITPRYVLTTARCLLDNVTPLTFFHVSIAEYSDENCTELSPFYVFNCTKVRHFGIDKKIIHPFYNQWTFKNNLALLRLNRIIPFTGYIKPICLRLPRTNAVDTPEMVYAASHTKWEKKRKASLKLISNSECTTKFKQMNKVLSMTEYEMCTIKSPSAAELTCGVFITSPIMSFSNDRWYLEGMRPQTESCPNEVPAVSTRISNYFPWIQEQIIAENCTTPHGEPGVCKYLKDCPRLQHAFANPEKYDDKQVDHYLHSFECPRNTNPQGRIGDVILVCCGISPNFTVRPVPDYKELEHKNAAEFDNFKYCGLQHTDDHSSTSDDIAIDEYPWTAAIYLRNTNYTKEGPRIICTGTLISRTYVLTAASCMAKIFDWDRVGVRLGEYNVKNATDCVEFPEFGAADCSTAEDYGFDRRKAHDFYDIFSTLNDIALLRLNKQVSFTDYIRPICLPSPNIAYVKPGDRLYSTGWGGNIISGVGVRDEAEIKKKVRTVLISNEECSESQQKIYDTTAGVSVSQFCTRDFRNQTDFLCDVDAGGPLMTRYENKWYIIGVSSRNACKQKIPQIHTNVTTFLGWIHRYIDIN